MNKSKMLTPEASVARAINLWMDPVATLGPPGTVSKGGGLLHFGRTFLNNGWWIYGSEFGDILAMYWVVA